jgi:hypothetical protein
MGRHFSCGIFTKEIAPVLVDVLFKQSRTQAQAKLDAIVEEANSSRTAIHILEKIYEQRTGNTVPRVPLEELAKLWEKLPRRRELGSVAGTQDPDGPVERRFDFHQLRHATFNDHRDGHFENRFQLHTCLIVAACLFWPTGFTQ